MPQTILTTLLPITLLTLYLLLPSASQPHCTPSPIPTQLPALSREHVVLDMNDYFHGPNLTIQLRKGGGARLGGKLMLEGQTHNLGTILSIDEGNGTVSMLGVTSVGKYFVYYASIDNPHALKAIQVPKQLINCTNHAQSLSAPQLSLTCQKRSPTSKTGLVHAVALCKLSPTDPQWQILTSPQYIGPASLSIYNREIEYLGRSGKLVVVVSHPWNSYVELWDVREGYERVMGVLDRVELGLGYLDIRDQKVYGEQLYILDYQTGVYRLKLKFDKFLILQKYPFTYYTKLSVTIDSIVLAKQFSITEFTNLNSNYSSNRKILKYEALPQISESIKQIIISQEYIVVYTPNFVVAYLRGYASAYTAIPTLRHREVTGVFVRGNETRVLQTFSIMNVTEVIFQEMVFRHPYLDIPASVPNNTEIMIQATSIVSPLTQKCHITFTLIRTEQSDMQIFENQYTKNGTQHLYMNRPGRAQIDLSPYAIGPDLHYELNKFSDTVNLTYEVRKVTKIKNVHVEGLEKLRARGLYLSDSCGQWRAQCPMAVDGGADGLVRYYLCVLRVDYYGWVEGIQCGERFKQFKVGEIVHYQIQQAYNQFNYFYQISVLQSHPDAIFLRKFQILDKFFNPILQTQYKIPGTPLYQQNNITQLLFDEDTKLLYLLLPYRKEIHILRLSENESEGTLLLELWMVIDASSIGGGYWAPREFQLDGDGMLWVRNMDHMVVIDLRRVGNGGGLRVLASVEVEEALRGGYEFMFQIVQNNKKNQLFLSQTIQSLQPQSHPKHLIILNENNTLLKYTITPGYQVMPNETRALPLYGARVPANRSEWVLQSLGNSQVMVAVEGGDTEKVGEKEEMGDGRSNFVYDLETWSLAEVFYAGVGTKVGAVPGFFYLGGISPVVMFLQYNPNTNSSQSLAYQISSTPKLHLQIHQMPGQTQTQLLILRVFNSKTSLRHSITLGISNSPSNLTKGEKFPYVTKKLWATDKYIELDTVGWVAGNVLDIVYVCYDCRGPEDVGDGYTDRVKQKHELTDMKVIDLNQEDYRPYVLIKGKLWLKGVMQIAGGDMFEIISKGETPTVAIMRYNMFYIFDPFTDSITGSIHQLTPTPTDKILSFRTYYPYRQTASILHTTQQSLKLVLYSIAHHKGFPLSTIDLPSSVSYVMNMEFVRNCILVLDFSSVYVIGVDRLGVAYYVDFVSEGEAGGSVCWVQLVDLEEGGGDGEYMMVITLCQSGVTLITFTLQQNYSVFKILNKQTLDLRSSLNQLNIRMPADSSFRRSLITPPPKLPSSSAPTQTDTPTLHLLMLTRNFNSFRWVLKLKNKFIVYEAAVDLVLHRYGDFGVTEDASIDYEGRYMVVSYYGMIGGVYQFVHAVYDLEDLHKGVNQQKYMNCYIMQAFQSPTQTSPKFTQSHNLITLPNPQTLKRIDVANKFRAIVHNETQLYSQSLYMIPYTPISSINIQILLRGVDIVEWQLWQILLIVVAGLLVLVIVGLVVRVFFGRYRERKKLVPLLVDYAEYEEELEEEVRARVQMEGQGKGNGNGRGSLITTDRGSVNV